MTIGDITPPDSTPERELLAWEHEQLRESLACGLAQSTAGETVDLGDFTQCVGVVDDPA